MLMINLGAMEGNDETQDSLNLSQTKYKMRTVILFGHVYRRYMFIIVLAFPLHKSCIFFTHTYLAGVLLWNSSGVTHVHKVT